MTELEKALHVIQENPGFIDALDDRYGRSGIAKEILMDALELSKSWDPEADELEDPE